MPVILVIEPDRRQTTKLSLLARNQLHADLLLTHSVEQALTTLDDHDPDLILTSPLLSLRDQAKLGERLRELAEDGLRVQTLPIPAFAALGQRARPPQKGAPVRGRATRGRSQDERPRPAADGLDPVVFGMQISAHLERAAAERAAAGPVLHARRPTPPPFVRDEVAHAEVVRDDVVHEKLVHEEPVQAHAEPVETWDKADWGDVLSAMRREIDCAQREPHEPGESAPIDYSHLAARLAEQLAEEPPAATVVEAESAPVEAAARPAESMASAAGIPAATADVQPPTAAMPATVDSAVAAAPARTKRVRRVPPQDEFGFFDPNQCGFSALFDKLNAINVNGTITPKKPA